MSKVPVELYANYMNSLIKSEINMDILMNSIYEELAEVKRQ
jgi:hypothetical protein